MLHATRISVRRGKQTCLDDVSFSSMGGELVAILGASGSGKTTLLDVCAGLVAPDTGDVWIAGQKLGLRPRYDCRVRLAYLTDDERWDMAVPVVDVVAMGCLDAGLARPDRALRARLCLASVGAAGWQRRSMPSLSLTQQLRVRLARLLMQMWDVVPDGSAYVLIDAPVGAADQPTQQMVFDIAKSLAKRGAAVALVTHDFTRVIDEADRVVVLKQGTVVVDGSPENVLTAGRLAVALDVDAVVEQSSQTRRLVVVPRPSIEGFALPF